jgi:hypothetical protein
MWGFLHYENIVQRTIKKTLNFQKLIQIYKKILKR